MATGPDLLGLLHRLSTGDVKGLSPGQGRETVVTSPKGRIVERLFVAHFGADGVFLLAGPGGARRVLAHLKKFTFAEKTGLTDVTEDTCAFALIGPKWAEASRLAGIPELSPCGSAALSLEGMSVHAVRTNGFDTNGVVVIGRRQDARPIGDTLANAAERLGGGVIDSYALEAWRILSGLPAADHELTEQFNPLEAGLREAVSFAKGCYVGQEVVARLNTYGKVSRTLVVLELQPGAPVPALGASIVQNGGTIGAVTSAILPPGHQSPVVLGYVKTRELATGGAELSVDDGGNLGGAKVLRN